MNENKDFKRFKRWCELKGLKPGNATSLQLYMKGERKCLTLELELKKD